MAEMEESLAKKGVELFREVLRLMDDAEVDDYFKNGVWRDDLMRLDLQLIDAHRKEGGAPEPPDLDEVPSAETLMPKPAGMDAAKLALLAQLRAGSGGAGAAGGLQGMLAARIAALRDAAKAGGAAPAAAGAAGTGPAAELRLVALFIAKWKLDPTRTKAVLAELSAPRRRYVIQKFKTDSAGAEATEHFETFIAECDLTNAWASAEAAAASAASPMSGAAAQLAAAVARQGLGAPQGIKRPLPLGAGASPVFGDAAKRARLSLLARAVSGGGAAGALGAQAAQASMQQRLAAAQAASLAARGGAAASLARGGGGAGLAGLLAARQAGALQAAGAARARHGAQVGMGQAGASQLAALQALRRQQQIVAASSRPAAGARPAGGGQAGGKPPGDLIRNLLQRF